MERTRKSETITLILYVTLILFLLLSVILGLSAYRKINELEKRNEKDRKVFSYIESQVLSNNKEGGIEIKDSSYGKVLCLKEKDGYETRIYLYEGSLISEVSLEDRDIKPVFYEKICELSALDLMIENSLLIIEADGIKGSAHIVGGDVYE